MTTLQHATDTTPTNRRSAGCTTRIFTGVLHPADIDQYTHFATIRTADSGDWEVEAQVYHHGTGSHIERYANIGATSVEFDQLESLIDALTRCRDLLRADAQAKELRRDVIRIDTEVEIRERLQ
ncbi:hypothetical protein [Rhodococcus sp. HNM0569]|uniref:hypothetical protein n=1 Tax=Rhodococcus sp. HNM0569 TaxID=2716340 RepID=UPI00146E9FCC|nr:hypothetical protein [Rhodococcus sp. HNM0569]NLU81621.1 hypothetical protein [Rhodococcus sp. HNM0569]